MARALGKTTIGVKADSQIIVSQVQGEFNMKGKKLKKYLQLIGEECDLFHYFCVQQVPRKEIQKADKLA